MRHKGDKIVTGREAGQMTYASTAMRRSTRLVTQLLITAIAIAATVLFTYALQHSVSTGPAHSGHTSPPTSTSP
ncbi:hypothetical protein J2W56_005037 [Nocardia kruczakiae]|uniref:Uncharacterized protein n=2 Tax=Nocardia kruczakiae TaxID=261477 RepID=A0ABU1XL36_9NOCA|nr:hypothetical protein [Nocardia kruczakiae]